MREVDRSPPDLSLPIEVPKNRKVSEPDIEKLSAVMSELPVKETRRRRSILETFYGEVLTTADPYRGIVSPDLLTILAH